MEASLKSLHSASKSPYADREALNKAAPFSSRYLKLKPLAEGGTSTIFLARDRLMPSAPVAIKSIHPQLLQDPATRFIAAREATIAKQLAHPGLVKVFDLRKHNDTTFLVMEYIEGESLKSLARRVRFDLNKVLAILDPLVSVLDYLHQQGVVHSDVKPSNIIITPNNQVKLIDLANCRQDSLNSVPLVRVDKDHFFGYSLDYSSPQVVNDQPATPSDDVFSLACIVYRLLEGQSPIPASKAVKGVPATVDRPPALSPRQWRVLQKAMSADVNVRYQSVRRFLDDLIRAGQFNRMLIKSAVAVVSVLSLGGFLWSAWQNYHSEFVVYKTYYQQNQPIDTLINDIRRLPPLERYLRLSLSSEGMVDRKSVLNSLYGDVVPPVIDAVSMALDAPSIPDYSALAIKLNALSLLYPQSSEVALIQRRLQADKAARIDGYQIDLSNLFAVSGYSSTVAQELVATARAMEDLGSSEAAIFPAHLSQYKSDIQVFAQQDDWRSLVNAYDYGTIVSEVFPGYLDAWVAQDIEHAKNAKQFLSYLDNERSVFPTNAASDILSSEFNSLGVRINKTWYNKDFAERADELLALKKDYNLPNEFPLYADAVKQFNERVNAKLGFHRDRNQVVSASNLRAIQKRVK